MNESIIQSLLSEVRAQLRVQQHYEAKYDRFLATKFSPFLLFNPKETAIYNILAFLLSPRETHAQGPLFLNAFCNALKGLSAIASCDGNEEEPKLPQFNGTPQVSTEYVITDNRRMDILLRASGAICIENKARGANDAENQLRDYAQWLEEHFKNDWLIVYLANHEPSEYSINHEDVKKYGSQIVQLDLCTLADALEHAAKSSQSLKVRYFVESFALYLRCDLSGESEMTDNDLLEILTKNENIDSTMAILNARSAVLQKIWLTFCETLQAQCNEPKNQSKIDKFEYSENCLTKRYRFDFVLKNHPQWCISFEANEPCLRNFAWGIRARYEHIEGNKINVGPDAISDKDVILKTREMMKQIFYTEGFKEGTRWPWWLWGDDSDSFIDGPSKKTAFPRYLDKNEWLKYMLEKNKETPLTNMIWEKVDAIWDFLNPTA